MNVCPCCKGRATKLVNATTSELTCQQCGLVYMPTLLKGFPSFPAHDDCDCMSCRPWTT